MTDPQHGAPRSPADLETIHPVIRALGGLREQLDHLEVLVGPELRAAGFAEKRLGPAWRRAHPAEARLPMAAAITAAIALQVALPSALAFKPTWVLPALEGALLVGITAASPRRIDRTSMVLRWSSIGLIALISLANGWSSAELIHGLVDGTEGQTAGPLLVTGVSIYLTNIVVFGLWYWEWDRGGPVARAHAERSYPDFLFPQMTQSDLAPPSWVPTFFDYFYVSFTNATAFSPTDTMPLALWAKMLMLIQSCVSLATVALVVARAVNILK
jgi:hypothetical protein